MKAIKQKLRNLPVFSTAPTISPSTVRSRWKDEHEAFMSFVPFLDEEDDWDDQPMLSRQRCSQSQAHISTLPTELLGHIFIEVCRAMVPNVLAFDPSHGYFGPQFWHFQCSYVCVYWRQVALSTPQLWAFIDFSTPRRTKLCFRRAKTAPLVIACRLRRSRRDHASDHAKAALEGRLLVVLERGRRQVAEIRLHADDQIHTNISHTLRHRAGFPLLTEMVLNLEMGNPETPCPPQSPPANPLLHTLDAGPNVRDIAHFGQTLCALHIVWRPDPEHSLLHAISACSRLQTLTVYTYHQTLPPRIPATLPRTLALLPCLRLIDITDDFEGGITGSGAMLLLNNLSLPRLASCRVKFRDSLPHAEHINSVLAAHFATAAPAAHTTMRLERHCDMHSVDPDAYQTLRFSIAFRFHASLDPALAEPRELALSWVRSSRLDPAAQIAFAAFLPSAANAPSLAAAWSAVDTLSLSWAPRNGDEMAIWREVFDPESMPSLRQVNIVLRTDGLAMGTEDWARLLLADGRCNVAVSLIDSDINWEGLG
ncbi:F-box domain-containing protein [Mycena indigotica]|uniref:F-box domain-containing protein n=1 Tax=Mycena indigotica TaxID=2126181 RepID=A0A8H6T1E2_9AGAR|nr:F-box domain-containing protein [Mycena indigotica]KAF7310235.1 F-box domain-containing protein [Mycena indigotica]